jgi:hypothetical protein
LKLGAIVRFADALDRSHDCCVADLRCHREGKVMHIQLKSALSCESELIEAERKRELFEQAFDCSLTFSLRRSKTKRA